MLWLLIILVSLVIALIAIVLISTASFKQQDSTRKEKYQKSTKDEYVALTPAEQHGKTGEAYASYILNRLLDEDEYMLQNLLVPINRNIKTEIDKVLITKKGIFCIEVKHWSGVISGKDEDEYWYQDFKNRRRPSKENKNPVLQNENHRKAIQNKLGNRYEPYNVVIFIDLDPASDIDSNCAYTLKSFASFYKTCDIELNNMEIDQIYKTLYPFVASDKQLNEYKEEIKNKYKSNI